MPFYFAVTLLILWFIRPQDWIAGLQGFNIIRPFMLVWLLVLLSHRKSGKWLTTAADKWMLIYFAYVVFTSPSDVPVVSTLIPFALFYYLTVHSIQNWEQLYQYLKAWLMVLIGVALLAFLPQLGMDFANVVSTTEAQFGRLSLGTWTYNNPNALGHSVVLVLPLAYYVWFWRGNFSTRAMILPLTVSLAVWCVYQTQSKGAFLVGAGLLVMIFVLGRAVWIQVVVLSCAAIIGVGGLSALPRMEQMGNLRADEGVQGRLLAWEQALATADANQFGVGWGKFISVIPWREGNVFMSIKKATHSCYVQVAADLGHTGLFLYIGLLWLTLKALLKIKLKTDLQVRCRGILFMLLLGYMASGFMINRQYHVEYFLMIAAGSVLWRLSTQDALENSLQDLENRKLKGEEKHLEEERADLRNRLLKERRIKLTDVVVSIAGTYVILQSLHYILENL